MHSSRAFPLIRLSAVCLILFLANASLWNYLPACHTLDLEQNPQISGRCSWHDTRFACLFEDDKYDEPYLDEQPRYIPEDESFAHSVSGLGFRRSPPLIRAVAQQYSKITADQKEVINKLPRTRVDRHRARRLRRFAASKVENEQNELAVRTRIRAACRHKVARLRNEGHTQEADDWEEATRLYLINYGKNYSLLKAIDRQHNADRPGGVSFQTDANGTHKRRLRRRSDTEMTSSTDPESHEFSGPAAVHEIANMYRERTKSYKTVRRYKESLDSDHQKTNHYLNQHAAKMVKNPKHLSRQKWLKKAAQRKIAKLKENGRDNEATAWAKASKDFHNAWGKNYAFLKALDKKNRAGWAPDPNWPHNRLLPRGLKSRFSRRGAPPPEEIAMNVRLKSQLAEFHKDQRGFLKTALNSKLLVEGQKTLNEQAEAAVRHEQENFTDMKKIKSDVKDTAAQLAGENRHIEAQTLRKATKGYTKNWGHYHGVLKSANLQNKRHKVLLDNFVYPKQELNSRMQSHKEMTEYLKDTLAHPERIYENALMNRYVEKRVKDKPKRIKEEKEKKQSVSDMMHKLKLVDHGDKAEELKHAYKEYGKESGKNFAFLNAIDHENKHPRPPQQSRKQKPSDKPFPPMVKQWQYR